MSKLDALTCNWPLNWPRRSLNLSCIVPSMTSISTTYGSLLLGASLAYGFVPTTPLFAHHYTENDVDRLTGIICYQCVTYFKLYPEDRCATKILVCFSTSVTHAYLTVTAGHMRLVRPVAHVIRAFLTLNSIQDSRSPTHRLHMHITRLLLSHSFRKPRYDSSHSLVSLLMLIDFCSTITHWYYPPGLLLYGAYLVTKTSDFSPPYFQVLSSCYGTPCRKSCKTFLKSPFSIYRLFKHSLSTGMPYHSDKTFVISLLTTTSFFARRILKCECIFDVLTTSKYDGRMEQLVEEIGISLLLLCVFLVIWFLFVLPTDRRHKVCMAFGRLCEYDWVFAPCPP